MKLLLSLACTATLLFAQTPVSNRSVAVEHAVPFGTVPGKLLVLDNYLVFFDEQQPESSFVMAKAAVEGVTAEGATISVRMRESLRNRTGEVRNLSFRVLPGGDPAPVAAWFGSGSSGPSVAAMSKPGAVESGTYQATHDHRIGRCTGRLIVGPEFLSYESIDDVNHSRRWEYKSIKETKHPNPYSIEIKPFEGSNYELKLEGSGMDPAAFKQLVDRITNARTRR